MKHAALSLSAIALLICLISFFPFHTLDEEEARQAVINFYDASIAGDAQSCAAVSFSEEIPDPAEHLASKQEYFNRTSRIPLISYEILSYEVQDENNILYTVRTRYADGLILEAPIYTKYMDGEWKVFIPSDIKKRIGKIIDTTPPEKGD